MLELFKELQKINDELKDKYSLLELPKDEIRQKIEEFGEIRKLSKEESKQLEIWRKTGPLVAVDGSVNRYGGMMPHFIDLFRSVAVKGSQEEDKITLTDSFSPLLFNNLLEEEEILGERERILASLEIKTAIQALEWKPSVLFIDGSLIRLKIAGDDLIEELKEKSFEQNTVIAGIIEDLKTDNLSKMMNLNHHFYDKEAFFNLLSYGEAIFFKPGVQGKEIDGLKSYFLRSSEDPSVIGIDLYEEQEEFAEDLLILIYRLTEKDSRGIPFIMDYVDELCRIRSVDLVKLVEHSLDPKIYHYLVKPQREKRKR